VQLVVMTLALEVIYRMLPVRGKDVLVLTRESLMDLLGTMNRVSMSCPGMATWLIDCRQG
jgi:hypothetical protein